MNGWTCLDCGKSFTGRFSDPCPECGSCRAIIDNANLPITKAEVTSNLPIKEFEYLEVAKSAASVVAVPPAAQVATAIESVSKVEGTKDTRRNGRPRLNIVVKDQMSFANLPKQSLRKRAALLGVSAATVLRRDREKTNVV